MKRVKWYFLVIACILVGLPSHAGAQNLLFDQIQTGAIGSAAQSNSYTFSANVDDVIDVTIDTTSGSLIPKLQIYSPNGTLISSNYSGAPSSCSGSTLESNTVMLPTAGIYTLVVSDCSNTNTGNYGIYAQRTNNPSGAANLPFDLTQAGTI